MGGGFFVGAALRPTKASDALDTAVVDGDLRREGVRSVHDQGPEVIGNSQIGDGVAQAGGGGVEGSLPGLLSHGAQFPVFSRLGG